MNGRTRLLDSRRALALLEKPPLPHPTRACDVPKVLWEELYRRCGRGDATTYRIEESTWTSQVAALGNDSEEEPVFISLTESELLRQPFRRFCLWPSKPLEEAGMVFAPRELLSIRGGLRDEGTWFCTKGNRLVDDVVLDFGYFTKLSLVTDQNVRRLVPWIGLVTEVASRLCRHVQPAEVWDGAGDAP